MLYSRRKRLQALAEAEARGESFWTDEFVDAARTKILYAARDACSPKLTQSAFTIARALILRDEGLRTLAGEHRPEEDLEEFLRRCDDGHVATCIEALLDTMMAARDHHEPPDVRAFVHRVNTVLSEHRVSFELVEGQMVELESQELHAEVIGPTVRLLSGRAGWQPVESAYRKALEEVGRDPADAITDAGTALQQALVLLGCRGNALGPLVKDAKAKGVLAPHDQTLADAIGKIIDWVAADRSVTGDTHNASPAIRADAWFAVHVVGALILRLTGAPRG